MKGSVKMKVSLVKKVVVAGLVVCAPFVVSGCSGQSGAPNPPVPGVPSVASEPLSVSKVKLFKGKHGETRVSAVFRNNTDKEISWFGVDLWVKDKRGAGKNGERLEAKRHLATMDCRSIKPGETCDEEYEMYGIEGWSDEEFLSGEFYDPVFEVTEVNYRSDHPNEFWCEDQIEVVGPDLLEFAQSSDNTLVWVKNNTGKDVDEIVINWAVRAPSGELVPFDMNGDGSSEYWHYLRVSGFRSDGLGTDPRYNGGSFVHEPVSFPEGSKLVLEATCSIGESIGD